MKHSSPSRQTSAGSAYRINLDEITGRLSWRGRLINLSTAIFFVLLALSFWRVAAVFVPNSSHTGFNSDSSFTVLMPNQDRPITLFDYYSYERDRWGSFPFLLARLFHQATGYHWSVNGMHLYRTIWLFGGLVIMTTLAGRARVVVLISVLIAICLPEITRTHMFDLSELYPWQIPGLFLAWYVMRRLFMPSTTMRPAVSLAVWSFALFAVAFLTVWTSVGSGPLLSFLVTVEMGRAIATRAAKPTVWPKLRYGVAFALVILAVVAEKVLRTYYHRYCVKRYGSASMTAMGFDYGYFRHNFVAQIEVLRSLSGWWPIILLPLGLFLALTIAFIYFSAKSRRPALVELKAASLDDVYILIYGLWGMALVNFVMAVAIEHIRLNLYSNRFLTLTFVFGVTSGLLTLFVMCRDLLGRYIDQRFAVAGFALAIILLLAIKFPTWKLSREFQLNNQAALALAGKSPGATVMGSYWATYVLVPLQGTNGAMLPLPVEGQDVRMPWTKTMLRDAQQIVVEYRYSNLAIGGTAPSVLTEYGTRLRLVDPNWYANDLYAFALYANDHQQ